MEPQSELLRKTYELAKDNNKMLRAMRRNAFLGGVFRIIVWAVMVIIPLYIYFVYFQPVITELTNSVSAMKAAGANATEQAGQLGAQFSNLQELLKGLPGFGGN